MQEKYFPTNQPQSIENTQSFFPLAQIRGTVFRALRHQDYPLPLLVEQLDANRDLSCPLFQVAFTWQKHRWYETASKFSGEQGKTLLMKPYSSGSQRSSALDLNLQIEEAGSSLVANWQYNTDLFDAATVSRMAKHFQTLLEAIVANPEQRVTQLPLLTEAERNQLLVEWNNTRTEYPQHKCIHQLFEEQVERTPDHVAVVFEDEQLTYRELNAKANQLAHYLQKLGVGLLCKEQVTVLNQTPSAFRQLIQVEESGKVTKKHHLRLVIFGGEALQLESLKPWFERHGDERPQLVNMYGITETTVHVTYRPLTNAEQLLAQLDKLSDEEVDSLLNEMLVE